MHSHQTLIKFLEQDGTVTLKTKEEIEAVCGFTWQDNINGKADFSATSYSQQQITDNSAKLVLHKFDDTIGYGILTDTKSTPLPDSQAICVYEGEQNLLTHADYRLGVVNALKRGNIARFVLHLPTNLELLQYEFKSPLTADDVATANIHIKYLDNDGVFPTLVSNRTIQPGEIIGYSYGDHFWDYRKIKPALFTRTGQIIDPSLYQVCTEKRKMLEEETEPLEKIRGSGWDCDAIDEACSNCKTIEEFHETLYDMTLSLCTKTAGREAIFWMGLYLELIVDLLTKVALQLPDTQSTALSDKVKPIKTLFRFFDTTFQEIKRNNIDNIAESLECIFADETLHDLPAFASAHEMLKKVTH